MWKHCTGAENEQKLQNFFRVTGTGLEKNTVKYTKLFTRKLLQIS